IWWTRFVAVQLWTCRGFAWELGWKRGRACFCASIDRGCATAAPVRHGRAETKIFAARRRRRNLGIRTDGSPCWLGPCDADFEGRTDAGRIRVRAQRRKTLVHERSESWCTCGDGAYAVEDGRRKRTQANHGVHSRCRYTGVGDRVSLPVHGTARALQRGGEVHRRSSAAREYHFEGRRRIKGCAYDVEHGATHIARRVRWPF